MMAEAHDRDHFASPAISPRWPLIAAAACFAFLAIAMVGFWLIFSAVVPTQKQRPATPASGPQLQADPSAELQAALAAQRGRLAGYRWSDRDAGVVAIPIERAMALIVQRGAEAYAPIAADPTPQDEKTKP